MVVAAHLDPFHTWERRWHNHDPSALEDEGLITIFTPLAKHFQRVGQFVVDLDTITVWIVKVNALLADMIDGPYVLNTVVLQRNIG